MLSTGANQIPADVSDAAQLRLWWWVLWVSHGLIPSELFDCLGLILAVRKTAFTSVVRNCPPFLVCSLQEGVSGQGHFCGVTLSHCSWELPDAFASCMQW